MQDLKKNPVHDEKKINLPEEQIRNNVYSFPWFSFILDFYSSFHFLENFRLLFNLILDISALGANYFTICILLKHLVLKITPQNSN